MGESFYLKDGNWQGWLHHLFTPVPGHGIDEWIGIWLAALLTLALFSFLWKDNPYFKLAEHIFVGVGTGYNIARFNSDVLAPKLFSPLFTPAPGVSRDLWLIVPLLLCLMTLMKLHPRLHWMARWPIAFVAGVTMGLAIITNLQSNVITQVEATIKPFRFIDEVWRKHTLEIITAKERQSLKPQELEALRHHKLVTLIEQAGRVAHANAADQAAVIKDATKHLGFIFKDQADVPVAPVLIAVGAARKKVEDEVVQLVATAVSDEKAAPQARQRLVLTYGKFLSGKERPEQEALRDDVIDQIAADRGVVPESITSSSIQVERLANAILIALGVVSGLVFFFFSSEHTGVFFGGLSRIGIWFLMISFGAAFGYTIMARISILIGRMQFLLGDWLHLSQDLSGILNTY